MRNRILRVPKDVREGKNARKRASTGVCCTCWMFLWIWGQKHDAFVRRKAGNPNIAGFIFLRKRETWEKNPSKKKPSVRGLVKKWTRIVQKKKTRIIIIIIVEKKERGYVHNLYTSEEERKKGRPTKKMTGPVTRRIFYLLMAIASTLLQLCGAGVIEERGKIRNRHIKNETVLLFSRMGFKGSLASKC